MHVYFFSQTLPYQILSCMGIIFYFCYFIVANFFRWHYFLALTLASCTCIKMRHHNNITSHHLWCYDYIDTMLFTTRMHTWQFFPTQSMAIIIKTPWQILICIGHGNFVRVFWHAQQFLKKLSDTTWNFIDGILQFF